MNTHLKFRLWDKYSKKFISQEEFSIQGNGNILFNLERSSKNMHIIHNCDLVNNFVASQCSGLYDCNTTEIYEGDILEVTVHKNHTFIDFVKFENGQFKFNSDHPEKSTLYDPSTYVSPLKLYGKIKVIGNIFENPELMEPKK